MPVVEQFIVIKAPMPLVMKVLNDVAGFPKWASVEGSISNIQGQGVGMTYDWYYSIGDFSFRGKSKVLEQTDSMLITKTDGDINSLWTVKLNSVSSQCTALRVIVEYTPSTGFIEALADLVLQQLSDPEIAQENINRFKVAVESRVEQMQEQVVVGH